MNSDLGKAMSKRDYHHRLTVKRNSSEHWKKYKQMKSFLNKEVKRCKCVYYKDLIVRNKHKPAHIISPSLTQL